MDRGRLKESSSPLISRMIEFTKYFQKMTLTTLKLTYWRCWACLLIICWMRSGCVDFRYDVAGWFSSNSKRRHRSGIWKTSFQRRHTEEALARSTRDRYWKMCMTTWWGKLPQSSASLCAKEGPRGPGFCLLMRTSALGKPGHLDVMFTLPRFILRMTTNYT